MTPVDQVQMFGVSWRQGDWLVREQDGVARLDHATAASIAAETAAGEDREVRSLVTGSPVNARSAGGL
jgi:regulator of RNase E activity RraA